MCVIVLTPSLNKSFKFQSDFPYNNSQIYLLQSIVNDIENDKDRTFKKEDNNFIFTSSVNYPNNRNLVKQKVTYDEEFKLVQVIVFNSDDVPCMTFNVKNISYNPKFKKDYFSVEDIMSSYEINKDIKETSSLDEAIYPLMLPDGTKLTNQEKISLDSGARHILTFTGEKPFILVEESSKILDEFTTIPTMGEPVMFMDTIGVLGDNSINFTSSGIDYYLVSDVMSQDELIEIANSINLLPTMK